MIIGTKILFAFRARRSFSADQRRKTAADGLAVSVHRDTGSRLEQRAFVEELEGRVLLSGTHATVHSTNAVTSKPHVAKPTFVEKSSASKSIRFLAADMDQFSTRLPVYDDVSSAGNHFSAFAAVPDANAPVAVNGSWSQNPHSGATAIRFELNTGGEPFGGFLMLNGVLGSGDTAPELNFGAIPNAGLNLTGATSLSFWAHGENGGERVDFFMGGAGYTNGTGVIESGIVEPDSTKAIGITVTLTKQWRKYTINLGHADLSYVLNGFGWAASIQNNPNGAIFYADDIQYNLNRTAQRARLNQPRFLVSYQTLPREPDPFDSNTNDDIDLTLRNTAFSYDNALAILAFLANGSHNSLRRAELIGDAFVYATGHDRTYTDGRVRSDYMAGDISLPPGWTPNGLSGTVPIPGFYSEGKQQFFEVEQGSVDTGNNAWVMVALLALYKATGNASYLDEAKRIGAFIESLRNDIGTYQGFLGGIDNAETANPVVRQYASVEHNEDINAAFTVMAQITGNTQWSDAALHAREFVESMFDPSIGLYRAGTLNPSAINTVAGEIPLDVQNWSVLTNSATLTLHPGLLDAAQSTFGVSADGFAGYDFNNDRDGVWFEGTGQVAVADAAAGRVAQVSAIRATLRLAQKTPGTGNGDGLAAASHDGLTTGFNFEYFRRLHVAATAWNVFAQLGYNPYYSGAAAPNLSDVGSSQDGTTVSQPISGPPSLAFTSVPGYGSTAELQGAATGVDPSLYQIAVFIKVSGGWWNKPLWDQNVVTIAPNGSWQADITTGELDAFASDITGFLVPKSYSVPLVSDEADLPTELGSNAAAQQTIHRDAPVVDGSGVPSLQFTSIPAIGSFDELAGTAEHVDPVDYQVAIFIDVNGAWWSKPTWTHPAVPIGPDGSWTADITTGGIDQKATDIAAFLVPVTYSIPLASGASTIPGDIEAKAVARVEAARS